MTKASPVHSEDVLDLLEGGFVAKEKEKEKAELANFGELFRFATALDVFSMVIAILCGTVQGALAGPGMMIVFADFMDVTAVQQGRDKYTDVAVRTAVAGFIAFMSGVIGNSLMEYSGIVQSSRWRKSYLRSILRQDIGWFDVNQPSELSSKIAANCLELENGINGKLLEIPRNALGMGLVGIGVAFYYSWDMALVMLASCPLVVLGEWFMSKTAADEAKQRIQAYGKAGGLASESILELRTVAALGAEKTQAGLYKGNLMKAQHVAEDKSWKMGLANGMMFGNADAMAASGLIYGAYVILKQQRDSQVTVGAKTYTCSVADFGDANPAGTCSVSGGDLMIAMFALQMGFMGLGMMQPALTALAKARTSAKQMLQVVERVPAINALGSGALKPSRCEGRIELKDVHFAYPARPDQQVCNGYNLLVEPGQTVALCGASGSGKSTAVQLIERFYDPASGSVELDGVDLREVNVRWLREQIGLVSQEPVLFSGSIADNIAMGKPGATRADVEDAAKMANAHAFVMGFPLGYDTDVGEKGGQLSGGQKQRIAIARAIIKNPAVLLLDEATSALDTESERIVQAALDDLLTRQKRTTIVIAHRLSTIRNADKICVVEAGRIVEEGTHDELIRLRGHYNKLVKG